MGVFFRSSANNQLPRTWKTERQSYSLQKESAGSCPRNQEGNHRCKEGHHQPHCWSQSWPSEDQVWFGQGNQGRQAEHRQEISQTYCWNQKIKTVGSQRTVRRKD